VGISASQGRALVPALAGLAGFLVMGALWATGQHALFNAAETQWGVWPGAYPFSDLEVLLSGIECKRLGIDAYAANPCDTYGRIFDYPPAWLGFAVFPVTTAMMVPAGIVLSLAFLASLLLLPPARTAASARLVAAGVLSSVTVFAVERGNNDLIVFILIAAACTLLARCRARWWGYGLIQLAGLLKYFPLAAMALALMERPARFWQVAALSVAVTALFAAATWGPLLDALATIPHGSPFRLVFGASNLGGGLVLIGAPPALGHAATALFIALGLAAGITLGLRPAAEAAVAALTPRERTFVLAGAAITAGCFFTAQNVNYRAVHMLLMLPSLTALRDAGAGRRYATLCWAALAVLWMDFFRIKILAAAYLFNGTAQHLIEAIPGFLLREVLWWWLIVHTLALLTALLKDAPVIQWTKAKAFRHTEPA